MAQKNFLGQIAIQNIPFAFHEYRQTIAVKTICVMGTVKEYKGKPEIVVENQEQIILQSANQVRVRN